MSLLKRIEAIFQSNANEIVRGAEDPKLSLDYSLMKLEESRAQVNSSLIEISAARRRLENQYDELQSAVVKYHGQAQAAVSAGRDDLARKALERMQETQERIGELEPNITNLDHQLEDLKASQANLVQKINLFSARKEELKAIYDASRAQVRLKETIYGISKDLTDIGSTIQRVEARIEEMQTRAQAIEDLAAQGILVDPIHPDQDDIDRELGTVRRRQLIDAELARLKNPARVTPPGGELPDRISPDLPTEQPPNTVNQKEE